MKRTKKEQRSKKRYIKSRWEEFSLGGYKQKVIN